METRAGFVVWIVHHQSLERVPHIASRAFRCPPPPDRNHLAFAPKDTTFTTSYSQGFQDFYRRSRRRFRDPWVGPINVALKRLKLLRSPQMQPKYCLPFPPLYHAHTHFSCTGNAESLQRHWKNVQPDNLLCLFGRHRHWNSKPVK